MASFVQYDVGGNDSFTKLSLHCDGVDGTNAFTDFSASAHTVTAAGNAQVDTAQSVFGGASLLLDGAGDYLTTADSADWALGAGDFVIDIRLRAAALGTDRTLVFQGVTGADIFHFFLTSGGNIGFIARAASVDFASYSATHGFSINTWYHVALVRSGTNIFIFKDGVAYSLTVTAAIGATAIPDYGGALTFGDNTVAPLPFNGWFDEIRWSKGTDRGWTSNFAPPVEPYG